MKFGISQNGAGHVVGMLRSIAKRVPDAARGQMKRSAARVIKKAKIYVPEDEGNLRDSIRIEKSYGYHGRLEIDIIAGNKTITKANGKAIQLDQYALMVHEAYETAVAPNGPGKNTRAKMSANPGAEIGSGFLFRALKEENDSFERVMVGVINRIIERESL